LPGRDQRLGDGVYLPGDHQQFPGDPKQGAVRHSLIGAVLKKFFPVFRQRPLTMPCQDRGVSE
jgi:hypothetical protein